MRGASRRRRELLPEADRELFRRLDDGRLARNAVSYSAAFASPEDVDETAASVACLLRHAERLIRPRLPDWHVDG